MTVAYLCIWIINNKVNKAKQSKTEIDIAIISQYRIEIEKNGIETSLICNIDLSIV